MKLMLRNSMTCSGKTLSCYTFVQTAALERVRMTHVTSHHSRPLDEASRDVPGRSKCIRPKFMSIGLGLFPYHALRMSDVTGGGVVAKSSGTAGKAYEHLSGQRARTLLHDHQDLRKKSYLKGQPDSTEDLAHEHGSSQPVHSIRESCLRWVELVHWLVNHSRELAVCRLGFRCLLAQLAQANRHHWPHRSTSRVPQCDIGTPSSAQYEGHVLHESADLVRSRVSRIRSRVIGYDTITVEYWQKVLLYHWKHYDILAFLFFALCVRNFTHVELSVSWQVSFSVGCW